MSNFFRAKSPLVLCLASLAAGALFPATLQAAPPSDAKAGIEGVYDQINADFVRRDLTHMMSYFTPDYVDVDEKGGRRTKDQERQDYQKKLGQIKSIQSRYTIQSVTATPSGTMVEMRLHSDGVGVKRILFAKLHGSFTSDLHVRDLWVETPQGWRLQHRQTLEDNLKVHPG